MQPAACASRYTSKERDPESGLDDFGARYYTSNLGRFVTPDWDAKPIDVPYATFGNPQSLNLYSYVQNNPTTIGDPDGHMSMSPPVLEEAEEVLEVVETVGTTTEAGAVAGGETGAEVGAVGGTFVEPGGGTAAGAGGGAVIGGVIGGAAGLYVGGKYVYDHKYKDPGPPPAPLAPKPPATPDTAPKPANPAPPSPAGEHDKGARPSTKDKHEKVRPGTSPPPNYKPDRKFKQPKDDKKKDQKPPYVRKDRDKPAS